MRLALIVLTLVAARCATRQAVREQPPVSGRVVTHLENPGASFDSSTVSVTTLSEDAPNLPRIVKRVEPYYPEIALRAGMQGTVIVQLLIGPSGDVVHATVVRTDADIFNLPSLEAALKWKFESPTVDGSPAAVRIEVPFRFAVKSD